MEWNPEFGYLKASLVAVIGASAYLMSIAEIDANLRLICGAVNAGATVLLAYLMRPPAKHTRSVDDVRVDGDSNSDEVNN